MKIPARSCVTTLSWANILLTYGEYWSNIVNVPSRAIAVGYPHLSTIVAESLSQTQVNPNQILLIADVGPVEETVQTPRALAAALPDYQIILKLHPTKIHLLSEYQTSISQSNIKVIGQADTYRLISESEIVIASQPSTVLIEAAAFPGKRVFFGSSSLLPEGIGSYFANAAELIDLIKVPRHLQPQIPSEQFWASNWQTRFDEFIESFIAVNPS